MTRIAMMTAALLVLGLVETTAQSPPLQEGTRIRVTSSVVGSGAGTSATFDSRVSGHLHRVGIDSLWLRLESPDGPLLAIARPTIHRLEIRSGRKRNPGKGALIGAGVGLGLGLLGAAALDDCALGRNWWFELCEGDEDVLVLGSTAAGAAWGALVGLLITSERWVTVPATSLELSASRFGPGLTLRLRLP